MQKVETVESYRLSLENDRQMDLMVFAASIVLLVIFSWKAFLLVILITVVQKLWMAVFDIPVLSRLRTEFQTKQAGVTSRMVDAARVRDLVQVHERFAAEAEVVQKLEDESAKTNRKIAQRAFLMQFV